MYKGHDIHNFTDIATADDCQKKCQELSRCQIWTHYQYGQLRGTCWLKDVGALHDARPCEPTFACTRGPKICQTKGRHI